jgi:hypothetical protein
VETIMSAVALQKEVTPDIIAPPMASSGDDRWLAMIEAVAANPAVDIARVEQLYALKERADKAKAEREFAQAMAAAQAEIAPVAKNKANTHTHSRYADLAAIADAVQPIYSAHGFALTFGVDQVEPASVTVICDVIHSGGHSRRLALSLPLDSAGSGGKVNKTALQATGSTITYGRRYLTCMAFNVAIADTDGNRPPRQSDPITDDQAITLREWIETTGSDTERLLRHFGAESIAAFPADKFDAAIAVLKKKKGQS